MLSCDIGDFHIAVYSDDNLKSAHERLSQDYRTAAPGRTDGLSTTFLQRSYSICILAVRATSPYFLISRRICAVSSSGVLPTTCSPIDSKRLRTSGSSSTLTVSACRNAITSGG